jgi:hypothetical protein
MTSLSDNIIMGVDNLCECNSGRTSLNPLVIPSAHHQLMESGDPTYFRYAQYLALQTNQPEVYIQDTLELVREQLNNVTYNDSEVQNAVQNAVNHFDACRLSTCVDCGMPLRGAG